MGGTAAAASGACGSVDAADTFEDVSCTPVDGRADARVPAESPCEDEL